MLISDGSDADVDRVTHEATEDEGEGERTQGQIEQYRGEKQLSRGKRRHDKDCEEGQHADALALDQALRVFEVFAQSSRWSYLESTGASSEGSTFKKRARGAVPSPTPSFCHARYLWLRHGVVGPQVAPSRLGLVGALAAPTISGIRGSISPYA